MTRLPNGRSSQFYPVRTADRLHALRFTAALTVAGIFVSLLVAALGVLLTGQRDWLAAITLALLVPLLLVPPICYPLLARLSAIRYENHSLRQQAREDHLTGLFNRPYLISMLERELSLSQRHDYTVSILLLEIADFTDILDQYGRHASEGLLRRVAERVGDKIRESDLFGRIDGAQFLLVLPHTNYRDALHMAQSLHTLTATIQTYLDDTVLPFEVRIGAASTENSGRHLNPLLNEADYALYQNRNEHHPLEQVGNQPATNL